MVDWDRVERLRSKGLDWGAIAANPKVHFAPPGGVEDPARALKVLYYSRKSRGRGRSKKGREKVDKGLVERAKAGLVPVGIVLALLGTIWSVFAYETSLVGVFLTATTVIFVAIAGLAVLGAGLVVGTVSFREAWKKPVAIGIVAGLLLVGSLALVGLSLGVCNLSRNTVPEPGGWESESPRNALCPSSGSPVVFYYGSIACPFCSASSWVLDMAVNPGFGTLAGTTYSTSNPGDIYPNTPSVNFAGSSLASSYVTWDANEGTNDLTTGDMPPLTWQEQAYVNTYDAKDLIPFFVIGGIFVHTGTSLVNPSVFLNGTTPLSPLDVAKDLQDPTRDPAVYQAIQNAAQYFEAYLVKADQIAGILSPASITSNAAVMHIVGQIR